MKSKEEVQDELNVLLEKYTEYSRQGIRLENKLKDIKEKRTYFNNQITEKIREKVSKQKRIYDIETQIIELNNEKLNKQLDVEVIEKTIAYDVESMHSQNKSYTYINNSILKNRKKLTLLESTIKNINYRLKNEHK